jgi:hypothetical protein
MKKSAAIPAVVGLMTLGATASTLAFAEPSKGESQVERPGSSAWWNVFTTSPWTTGDTRGQRGRPPDLQCRHLR